MSGFRYIKDFIESLKNEKYQKEEQFKVLYWVGKSLGINFPKYVKERTAWKRRMANLDFIINQEMSYNEASVIKEIMGLLAYAQRTKEWITIDNYVNQYFESICAAYREELLDRCELVIEKLEDAIETQNTLSESIVSQSHIYQTLECEKFFSNTKALYLECKDLKEEIISTFLDISISNWDLTNILISKIAGFEMKAYFIEGYNSVILHSLKSALSDPGMLALIQSMIS